ncbi:rootletin-like isoform X1 [Xyrichtys novacula]|uniref:Rootletin-like isoform X1 n=1 Tax=Xyrichtys novacula TaxID=13765 RepID=A0AAV1F439_XYRNO|nr:rootletin-like isoform X1 [Xyrichtys novacula]
MENSFKMSDRQVRMMIELRATNHAIFTGKRHSAMRGWRAITREMGLQGLVSPQQMKKRWENLKEKYRSMKNPPEGMENQIQPKSWRWFQLMDEAMTGRLAGTANIIQPSPLDTEEDNIFANSPLVLGEPQPGLDLSEMAPLEEDLLGDDLELNDHEKMKPENRTENPPQVVSAAGSKVQVSIPECQPQTQTVINSQPVLLYATLLPDRTAEARKTPPTSRDEVRKAEEVDRKLVELQRERRALEQEQVEFDRELIALERDRELLRKDMSSLERERASLDRERAAVERDRAALEKDQAILKREQVILDRDRAFLDRDRAFLERDRVFVQREREDFERERALWRRERDGDAVNAHPAEMTAEKEVVLQTRFYQSLTGADLDPDQLETRQRLVSLFQRLVEKL